MVILYVSLYESKRMNEFLSCIYANEKNKYIDKIYLINESGIDLSSEKIISQSINFTPSFSDYLDILNSTTTSTDIKIIANNDIVFNESLYQMYGFDLYSNFLCLSRWEIYDGLRLKHIERNDSQDSWIFQGNLEGDYKDIFLGRMGCDNQIAKVASRSRCVLNPSFEIKVVHLHENRLPKEKAILQDKSIELIEPLYSFKEVNLQGILDFLYYTIVGYHFQDQLSTVNLSNSFSNIIRLVFFPIKIFYFKYLFWKYCKSLPLKKRIS